MPTITEDNKLAIDSDDIRQLRDNIYGPTSDDGWFACGPNWCKPENVKWLLDHQPIPKCQKPRAK